MKKFIYLFLIILFFPLINVSAYQFRKSGNVVTLNRPDSNKYFSIGLGDVNVDYTYVSSDSSFFLSCYYSTLNDYRTICKAFDLKIRVSESVFNDHNSDFKYYDRSTGDYYIFESSSDFSPSYRLHYDTNYWGSSYATPSTQFLWNNFSSPNVDCYYYKPGTTNDSYNHVDYAPRNVVTHNVTFHLNGGTSIYQIANIAPRPSDVHTSDYTSQFYDKYELYDYLQHITVQNDIARFTYWYYDPQLTQLYNHNSEVNSDIDLYAAYEYVSVNSIIDNIDFVEYTYPDEYEYAVISVKQDFSQGLYISLGFNFQYLDAYTYNIVDQAFTNSQFRTLTSIGSFNNRYYYHLLFSDQETTDVLVIDKADLVTLGVDNQIQHYYTFYVSSNCYVYFTNDLTQVSYYIPSNNGSSSTLLTNQDVSSVYDYTRQFIIDSNSDIITTFINLIKNGDFSIFQYFTQLWYKFRAFKILNYFLILSLGALIVALVKGGSRH